METWIPADLWRTDFLDRGCTVLWTRKTLSDTSSIVGGNLWWSLTACLSEWRISNIVFQAWAASLTPAPYLWPLWRLFDWPLSLFWRLCCRDFSCRHWLDFQDHRRSHWMFDKDPSTWFFSFLFYVALSFAQIQTNCDRYDSIISKYGHICLSGLMWSSSGRTEV